MLKTLLRFATLLGWLFSTSFLLAQQPDAEVREEYYKVFTTDGNRFAGRLLRMDSIEVVLETEAFPELVISRRVIKRMYSVPARRFAQALSAEETPVAGHYFINGSAYGPPAGSGYYATTLLMFHQAGVGLSDNFSMRGAVIFDIEDFNFPTWTAPKISFPVKQHVLQVALEGVLGRGFATFNENGEDDFAGLQLLATVGPRTTNLTVGGGVAWINGRWSRQPFFSLSGAFQFRPRVALISENYIFRLYGSSAVTSGFGMRIYGRRANLDLGLLLTREEYYVYAFPLLGLSVNFY